MNTQVDSYNNRVTLIEIEELKTKYNVRTVLACPVENTVFVIYDCSGRERSLGAKAWQEIKDAALAGGKLESEVVAFVTLHIMKGYDFVAW